MACDRHVVGFCDCGNVPSGFIQCGEFLTADLLAL